MNIRPTPLIAVAAVVAAVALALPAPTIGPADAGATPRSESVGQEVPAPPDDAHVSLAIADFAFPGLVVAAGTTVVVDNHDAVPHTVTGDGFDVEVDGGGTATFVAPAEVGEHAFQCLIHPAMQGVLVVR